MSLDNISDKPQGIVVAVAQKESSAVDDPLFENLKDKARHWLNTVQPTLGREMDTVFFNEDRFELMIDTRGYTPEDLICTVGAGSIEVTAQRQEGSGTGQRSMSTARSYQLPKNVDPGQAICCLSSEGILLVTVPWLK